MGYLQNYSRKELHNGMDEAKLRRVGFPSPVRPTDDAVELVVKCRILQSQHERQCGEEAVEENVAGRDSAAAVPANVEVLRDVRGCDEEAEKTRARGFVSAKAPMN